jgi:hypothetical protein
LIVVGATDGPPPELLPDQTVLSLEPWTREEMEYAVVFALGRPAGDEAERAFLEALVANSDGTPLHFTHLLRLVRDSNAVHLAEGGYRTTGAILDLPKDAMNTITGRILQLPPSGAAVLAQAAEQGMEFDMSVLDGDAVMEVLDAAEDGRLVQPDPERLNRYWFTHALVRAAALGLRS